MAIFLTAHKNRTCDLTLTLTDSAGVNSVLSVGDVVRLKLGRSNAIPILDLDSAVASVNGSTVGSSNPVAVHLDQADTNLFGVGVYDLEVAVVDASAGNKIKHVEKGVISILGVPLGGIDET